MLAGGAACSKTQAAVPTSRAPLVTPDPPDRVIVPVALPAVPPPSSPPAATPAPAAPRPRDTPAARPPVERAAPASTPAPNAQEAPTQPPPVLETTQNSTELELQARAQISAAQRNLDQFDRSKLGSSARAQYEAAQGFIRQADNALKVRNVALAKELADKAAALAGQLGH